jgi:hypothetical protein
MYGSKSKEIHGISGVASSEDKGDPDEPSHDPSLDPSTWLARCIPLEIEDSADGPRDTEDGGGDGEFQAHEQLADEGLRGELEGILVTPLNAVEALGVFGIPLGIEPWVQYIELLPGGRNLDGHPEKNGASQGDLRAGAAVRGKFQSSMLSVSNVSERTRMMPIVPGPILEAEVGLLMVGLVRQGAQTRTLPRTRPYSLGITTARTT